MAESIGKKTRRSNTDEIDMSKPKFYVLDMFPYPSGSGLHVGHPEGYTATDIVARMKRMQGIQRASSDGLGCFWLAGRAICSRYGKQPAEFTEKTSTISDDKFKSLGFSYDWDREFSTTDPDYYKWTQWIFIKLYEQGLAYMDEVPVNWCPALGTVLGQRRSHRWKKRTGRPSGRAQADEPMDAENHGICRPFA